jgi:electron transfer flavoprotein-quinone oxidoreductase
VTKLSSKFDVIVVGAGLAGSAAALEMARAGLNVCIIERAIVPGEKNVTGGVMFKGILDEFIPNWKNEAPIERWISKKGIGMVTAESLSLMQYETERNDGYNACTLNRVHFDSWLANKAEVAGATLLTNTLVEDVILEDGFVKGVKTHHADGFIYADIVICADGVNSLVAQKAGLRKQDISPKDIGLGIKEILSLPEETINERFGLKGSEGCAYEFVGEFLKGVYGGAFLYTNCNTLSIGIVVNLGSIAETSVNSRAILEHFKNQPQIKKFIEGGSLVEYSAHLVPEVGLDMVPQLYGNGILVTGDAAGLVINNGFSIQGMNYAIASGREAGRTAVDCIRKGNVSARELASYKTQLDQSFVGKNLKKFQNTHKVLANPRIGREYPVLIDNIAKNLFGFEDTIQPSLSSTLKNSLRGNVSPWQLIKDGYDIWRYM